MQPARVVFFHHAGLPGRGTTQIATRVLNGTYGRRRVPPSGAAHRLQHSPWAVTVPVSRATAYTSLQVLFRRPIALRDTPLRAITGTLIILVVTGYLLSTVELPRAWSNGAAAKSAVTDGWRRTATGWEWDQAWQPPRPTRYVPYVGRRIHPGVIAALQLLVSLFALVATDRTWRVFTPPHGT